jgi:non-canonical (house-cleaning) NTP pyrophosphatase
MDGFHSCDLLEVTKTTGTKPEQGLVGLTTRKELDRASVELVVFILIKT